MAPSRPTICATCGEEVRFGTRATGPRHWHEAKRWLHREEVDHVAVLGQPVTPEQWAEIQHRLEERAAEHRTKRSTAEEYDDPDDDEGSDVIEPIELRRINLPQKGRLLVGTPDGEVIVAQVPGGARTIINLAAKIGWSVTRLTFARGPYIGAKGTSLGVSDSVVLHVQGVQVDGSVLMGVACWRDGKSDGAYRIKDRTLIDHPGAKALIAWMKENPCGS